jgi:hypothetical protein
VKLREYNNISYKDGETINYFNLHFTKLYNQIPELIFPQNQAAFMHYYNALPSPYRHRIEKKDIDNLGSTLHTCLEYEEKLERTDLPKGDLVKKTNMYTLLQLVQDMNNRMITYERKGNASSSGPGASSSSLAHLRIIMKILFRQRPLCLAIGVTSVKKIMKKLLVKLRKIAEIRYLAKEPIPQSPF